MLAAMRRSLVPPQHLGCRSPARLVLEIDVGQRAAVGVADDEALPFQLGIGIIDRPGRRKAAGVCALSPQLPKKAPRSYTLGALLRLLLQLSGF
jgi:hypothetical protein